MPNIKKLIIVVTIFILNCINPNLTSMAKNIFYNDYARRLLQKGMAVMVEAVSITLGPKGRNVVLDSKSQFAPPQIINDGVTIAREITLRNRVENTGVSLIRQAASKTNDVAGDGTTTATVLAYAMVKEGLRNVTAGANPISIKSGMEKATQYIVDRLNELAQPIEDLQSVEQVASISAGNDDEMGIIIAQALEKVGKDGIITLEEGKDIFTELRFMEGMRLDRGFMSPYFITDTEKMEVYYENPYILLTDERITLFQQDLLSVLEQVVKVKRPLLVIADTVESEALATLVLNKIRRVARVVAIRAPGFGDYRKQLLEDIAILTGGRVISRNAGLSLENVQLDLLGQASNITVTRSATTIVGTGETLDAINIRCEQLRKQVNLVDTDYEKEKLQDRIAKLASGIAAISIGAFTETEMNDKKLRLEDSINATRAAVEEGILPGGGAPFAYLSPLLKEWADENLEGDENIGATIISRAIVAPLRRIVENADESGGVIIEKMKEKKFEFDSGYDAAKKEYGNMYDRGIIDPVKVTRSALQNATSIASMILTTECVIVENTPLN